MEDIQALWQASADDATQPLVLRRWTYDEWTAWLSSLTPRVIVAHVRRWCLMAQEKPDMRDQLASMIDDALGALRRGECHL